MKITIQDRTYDIAYTFRAIVIFEKSTNKMFTLATITDQLIFYYAMLNACNDNVELSFEEFVDEMNDGVMAQFAKIVEENFAKKKMVELR